MFNSQKPDKAVLNPSVCSENVGVGAGGEQGQIEWWR